MERITDKSILRWIFYGLLAYMPFHLFLSRWLSQYSGGLGQWDAGKDIITVLGVGVALTMAYKQRLYRNRYVLALFLLTAAYGLTHVLTWLIDRHNQDLRSAIVATLYNGRLFAYLFIGLMVGTQDGVSKKTVLKTLLIVSTITCVFAFVQYLGPDNLMSHFGYSVERGAKPSFFIDDKPDFPRVFSTIRDPNSYGAYLIIPITVLWAIILRVKKLRKNAMFLGAVHVLALILTFSRGAWLGLMVSIMLVTFLIFDRKLFKVLRKHRWIIGVSLLALIPIIMVVKNQYVFQNVFLHSDKSTVMADPNELRISLQKEAAHAIIQKPLGHGPGTAGLVSIGNPKGTRLTENYFLQIGYEVGVLGLLVFVSLLGLIYYLLLKAPRDYLAWSLMASFWAYVFISTLIHLWSNEAVAAQWWLLAGLVIGQATLLPLSRKFSRKQI